MFLAMQVTVHALSACRTADEHAVLDHALTLHAVQCQDNQWGVVMLSLDLLLQEEQDII